ncbi:hypothetical protein TNCV_3348041 [Trichonephila clavipes]|nr:hypothetical protein TNCV_3348041 [Trichonephila clavipes]
MVATEPDPHDRSSGRSAPYPANQVHEHRNTSGPQHKPSFIHPHASFPYFNRKLWIVQAQFFGHFSCTVERRLSESIGTGHHSDTRLFR